MTDGVILLSKSKGETSFHALSAVKRALGTKKVGHTGTLDKFAEGLLLVLSGALTRLCPYAGSLDKEYVAEVTFGLGTDTLDPEGEVVAEGPVPSRDSLRAMLPRFTGDITQKPPSYSAVHVDGMRAYQLARRGADVEPPPRQVHVETLDLVSFAPPRATLRISCSKGTYVRSLARDLAAALGTVAHVSGLIRTRVGDFRLAEAVTGDAFDPARHLIPASTFFARFHDVETLCAREEWIPRILHGAPLRATAFQEPPRSEGFYAVLSPSGQAVAMVNVRDGIISYDAVLAQGGKS